MIYKQGKIYRFTEGTKRASHSPGGLGYKVSIAPGKYVYNIDTRFLCTKLVRKTSETDYHDTNFLNPVKYTFVTLVDLFTLAEYETITADERFEQCN